MPITELLPDLFPNNFHRLSKIESTLLEANIFVRVTDEVIKLYETQYKNYLKLLKNEVNREDEMIEANFLRLLINDIVSTNDYTLEGVANFVRMPVDAILEIVSGINLNPSLLLAARIVKLHSDVRKGLYSELIKKFLEESVA